MCESARPTGLLNKPINNRNKVAESIKAVAAAKRAGAFTFQVGRSDKYLNMAMAALMAFNLVNISMGCHKLVFGYGKKEGF